MTRLLRILDRACSDPAVRYGLKFGIAGLSVLFLALLIRLQEPVWSLFTVFMLMIAHYVGAVGEKSVFRLIGTVVGALIGYLLTGSLEQVPWIVVPLAALIVAGCTAMFGQSRYPYAFLLCGLTTVVVMANGMHNPGKSWQYMIWRVEEVSLGIIVTLVVQSVLWPRYARLEFLTNLREGFADLRSSLSGVSSAEVKTVELAAIDAAAFPSRLGNLRRLLDFGARESKYFRERLTTYFELTSAQARMSAAISTIKHPLRPDSPYFPHLAETLHSQALTLQKGLQALSEKSTNASELAAVCKEVDASCRDVESALLLLRSKHIPETIPAAEAMDISIRILAFQELSETISSAARLIASLPQGLERGPSEHPPFISPWPPPFWIRTGIKAGLAFSIALILENWLRPPGGTMFVLGTWVFTAMNASSPGGQGDRRSFTFSLITLVALTGLSLLLLAATPMLSDYAVLNTVAFTWLFLWGYLSYSAQGMTIPMQLAMLCLVGVVALNPQQPVSFQQIVDFFFGLAMAVVLSAVIQRTIWPSLPQWEVRDRLIELLDIAKQVLKTSPGRVPLWLKMRLALIPGEVALRTKLLGAGADHLSIVADRLSAIIYSLSFTSGKLDPLLQDQRAHDEEQRLRQVEAAMADVIEATAASLYGNRLLPFDRSKLDPVIQGFHDAMGRLRLRLIQSAESPGKIFAILGYAERYRLSAEGLADLRQSLVAKDLSLLNSDTIL